jgi:hypothetical protein
MRWMLSLVAVLIALIALESPGAAQVQSRPTDPPLVTAANESWYLLREPLQFAGELYVPSGAAVFFDGDTMVRAGHYNGVPLYADTTVEPFSIVLVPISRGLLQPYQRLRGYAAAEPLMAPVPPTILPAPIGAIGVYTPQSGAAVAPPASAVGARDISPPLTTFVGTTGVAEAADRQTRTPIASIGRPENNDGVWIRFGGEKWISAGAAIPLVPADFIKVGEYGRFPVFARRELTQDMIYLPTRAGLVAPYRLKE